MKINLSWIILSFICLMVLSLMVLPANGQAVSTNLESAYDVSWNFDGSILAITADSGLWLYHISTGSLEFAAPSSELAFSSWTGDGRIFIGTGFFNPTTKIQDPEIPLQQPADIFSVLIGLSADSRAVAFLEGDYLDTIAVYDTNTGAPIRRIATGNPNAGPQIDWGSNDTSFAMLTPDRPSILLIPNADNPTIVEYPLGNALPLNQIPLRVKWSPDGRLIAIGTTTSRVILFDVQSQKVVGALDGLVGGLLAWSRDAKYLAVGDTLGSITLYDVVSLQAIQSISTPGRSWSMEFSRYGGQLAVANQINQSSTIGIQQATDSATVSGIVPSNAVQLHVFLPTTQHLEYIATQCQSPIQPSNSNTSHFVQQLATMSDTQISPACRADLLAVAAALQASP